MRPSPFGTIRQVAWLTRDLGASMRRWTGATGIGPWTCYRNVLLEGRYRGAATTVGMDVGLAYQDGLQIELIEPTNDAVSPYRDHSGAVRVGMHHIAWIADDFPARLAEATRRGLSLVFEAMTPAGRVAYLEDAAEPGLLFEFIEGTAMLKAAFGAGLAAARDWDGETLVSEIDFAA